MGYSMSFYVERRVDGRWEHVSGTGMGAEFATILRGRNVYAALMGWPDYADIGTTVKPIDGSDKGVPADASDVVLRDYEPASECCYPSWHTLAALLAYDWKANGADDCGEDLAEAIGRMKTLGAPGDVRCIFWLTH